MVLRESGVTHARFGFGEFTLGALPRSEPDKAPAPVEASPPRAERSDKYHKLFKDGPPSFPTPKVAE